MQFEGIKLYLGSGPHNKRNSKPVRVFGGLALNSLNVKQPSVNFAKFLLILTQTVPSALKHPVFESHKSLNRL